MELISILNCSEKLLLNGSGLFTMLSLLLALVAYIRNTPIPHLLKAEKNCFKEFKKEINRENKEYCQEKIVKLWWLNIQLSGLNLIQIWLVFLSVMIARHFTLCSHQESIDLSIAENIFLLSLVLLAYHLYTNFRFALKSCEFFYIFICWISFDLPNSKVTEYIDKRLKFSTEAENGN